MRFLFILLTLASLAAPPVMAEGTRVITGAVLTRERIALPPEATLTVEVSAQAGVISTARLATGGRQVPLRFALAVPTGTDLTLRAGVSVAGATTFVSDTLPIAAGDGDIDLGAVLMTAAVPLGFATRLNCGDETAEFGIVQDGARLRIRGEVIDLVAAPSASGALYVARDLPDTSVFTKGNEARVTLRGVLLPTCILAAASVDDAAAALPSGGWRVTAISGAPLPSGAGVTLDFLPDGRVSGRAGCNRYAATVTGDATRFAVGPVIATKMACAPDLMTVEARFLAALATVSAVRVTGQTLTLSAADGTTIDARR